MEAKLEKQNNMTFEFAFTTGLCFIAALSFYYTMSVVPIHSLHSVLLPKILEKMSFEQLISFRKTCRFADRYVRKHRKILYSQPPSGFSLQMDICENRKKETSLYFTIFSVKHKQEIILEQCDRRISDLPFQRISLISYKATLSAFEERYFIETLNGLELSAPRVSIERFSEKMTLRIINNIVCEKELIINCASENLLELQTKISRPFDVIFDVTKETVVDNRENFDRLNNYIHLQVEVFCATQITHFLQGLRDATQLRNFKTALFTGASENYLDDMGLLVIWNGCPEEQGAIDIPSKIYRMDLPNISKWAFIVAESLWNPFVSQKSTRIIITQQENEEQMQLLSGYFLRSRNFGQKFCQFLQSTAERRLEMNFINIS